MEYENYEDAYIFSKIEKMANIFFHQKGENTLSLKKKRKNEGKIPRFGC